MAYRAEIEISVRGTRQLEELRSKINQSAVAADSLNESLGKQGRLAQSLGNYERLLGKAAGTLKDVIAGTEGETKAIKEYVTILGQANEAQTRQNGLIEREIALRNRLKDAGPRTALRAQERQIFVEETISRGRSARIARERSAYLQGPGRTAEAERLAQLAAEESVNRQAQFKAREAYAKQIFDIEKSFNKQLVDYEIDNLMRTFKLEESMQTRLFNQALELDKKEGAAFDAELKRRTAAKEAAFEKERRIAEQVAKSSPIGGAENIPGSPAFLRARARRRREATGSAIIGGAFPLLFGQGVGASVGGGLGGAAGGALGGQFGFGLSLVGTAAGQAVDNFINSIKTLGESLKDPAQTLTALEEAGFAVDDSVKQTVEQLLEANKVYEAQAVALQQITDTLGPGSVELLNAYDKESKKLNSLYQDLTASITRSLLPALVGAVAAINDLSAGTKNIQIPSNVLKVLSLLSPSQLITGGPAELLAQRGRQAAQEAGRPDLPDNPAATEAAQKARETADQLERQAATLRDQIRLAELNGDLTDERVFNLRKSIIFQEAALKLAEDGLTTEQRTVIELERKFKLQNLLNERVNEENRARENAARKAERAAREAERAAKEAARAQKQRIDQLDAASIAFSSAYMEQIKLFDEVERIQKGEEAMLIRQNKYAESIFKIEKDTLMVRYKKLEAEAKSAEEQDFLKKTLIQQLSNLGLQRDLGIAKRNETLARLRAEKLITEELQNQERQAGLTQIDRSVQRIGVELGMPFQGEERERQLQILEQQFRQEDQLAEGKKRLLSLEQALLSTTEDTSNSTIEGLQREIAIEKIHQTQLQSRLSVLDQAEQAQLRQNQLMERYGFLANELSTAMSTAVQAVVTGTGTVEEAFATMFQNIGRAFIDMATQMLAQKLFMTVLGALGGGFSSAGGSLTTSAGVSMSAGTATQSGFDMGSSLAGMFKANGGPVNANQPYIVGERGPELFMPSSSGMVMSNAETRTALNRQLDNRRSNATTETMQAKPLEVKYESTVINNVEYVTAEQHRKGMAQAAERGRALTLQALQGSVKTRKKVGL